MKFKFLKAFFSPFKRPHLHFYIGRIAIGTPYFLPRVWRKSKEKEGYLTATPRIIGFDFIGLGWKTKWSNEDYRFEWAPIWSFVFLKWQIAIMFIAPHQSHYWESWLFYEYSTDKTKNIKERIKICREEFPNIWTSYKDGKAEKINYYEKILKKNYL